MLPTIMAHPITRKINPINPQPASVLLGRQVPRHLDVGFPRCETYIPSGTARHQETTCGANHLALAALDQGAQVVMRTSRS